MRCLCVKLSMPYGGRDSLTSTCRIEATFFLLSPLKPGYFGRLRHELDSPKLVVIYPIPDGTFPENHKEVGCGVLDNESL
ncbi:hypothetical protein AVEN_197047-1 [Araneus ventricosus]|uniref:Uncharacterized protein n=1 Tax=Araneus ventricosus TaxID=182803 RepID=A0A4Y2UXY0_ARAVE|nr:hypothetical protein AVEN_197047-1 [Araneus ventricosus]